MVMKRHSVDWSRRVEQEEGGKEKGREHGEDQPTVNTKGHLKDHVETH